MSPENFHPMHRPSLVIKGLAICALFASCAAPKQSVFSSKERTSRTRDKSANKESVVDKLFTPKKTSKRRISADDKALNQPLAVSLPYRETGFFEEPGKDEYIATGYAFHAKRGEQVKVEVETDTDKDIQLFTELFEKTGSPEPMLLGSADGVTHILLYDVEKDGNYILRMQPESDKDITYTVTITTGPSLAFPIDAKDKPRVSSFWGASRDNGERSHEGIDIVAKKYTPLLAVADGVIIAVKNGGLGGKTVSLRPYGKNYSVYYAHLDEQLVVPGQAVKTGDVIGKVGNTGNAAKTVPHLHFGIYTNEGAVDPILFVQTKTAIVKTVKADVSNLGSFAKIKENTSLFTQPAVTTKKIAMPANRPVRLLAASDNYYRVQLPDGQEGFVPAAAVSKEVLKKKDVAKNNFSE